MGIIISKTVDSRKDIVYNYPVAGKASVREIKTGIFSTTIITADIECEGSPNISGDSCGMNASYFGSNYSGNGVITSSGTIKEGGQTGTPYTQKLEVFMEAE